MPHTCFQTYCCNHFSRAISNLPQISPALASSFHDPDTIPPVPLPPWTHENQGARDLLLDSTAVNKVFDVHNFCMNLQPDGINKGRGVWRLQQAVWSAQGSRSIVHTIWSFFACSKPLSRWERQKLVSPRTAQTGSLLSRLVAHPRLEIWRNDARGHRGMHHAGCGMPISKGAQRLVTDDGKLAVDSVLLEYPRQTWLWSTRWWCECWRGIGDLEFRRVVVLIHSRLWLTPLVEILYLICWGSMKERKRHKRIEKSDALKRMRGLEIINHSIE